MQDQRHNGTILGVAWLAVCLTAVALGQALRLTPFEAAYAWPLARPAAWLPQVLFPVALVWVGIAALLLLFGAAFARARGVAAPWARLLLIHPLLLAFIWLVWPANGRQPWSGVAPEPLMLAALGVAGATWLGLRRGRMSLGPAPRPREFIRDGVILLVILAVGHFKGPGLRPSALIPALVTYPLFAVAQLLVMMILPASDLIRCGVSRRVTVLACGLVFGALHWPNPVLAVATCAAMALWTWDRLKGRGLVSLALGMGLLGAAFSQTLPDTWTRHMRVGPGLVRQAALEDMVSGRLWFTPGNPDWDTYPPLPAEFLGTLYPGVVGRPIQPEELALWRRSLDRARRRTVIWQFLSGAEYARKERLGPPPAPFGEPEDRALHWRKQIDRLDDDAFWDAHGADWNGYLAGLYRELLGREPSTAELAAWTPRLSLIQRRQIGEVLLRHAQRWRQDPPRALPIRRLVAPQIPLLVARFP